MAGINAGLLKYLQSKKKGGSVAPAKRFIAKQEPDEGTSSEEAQDVKEQTPKKRIFARAK